MTFSRSFRSQTWFVRFPHGAIEVLSPIVIERSFRAGMVDSQTPVLAVGGHVWMTLGEAAGEIMLTKLPAQERISDADIDVASWRSGGDVDVRAFKGNRGKSAALVALGSVAGLVLLLSTQVSSAYTKDTRAMVKLPLPVTVTSNDPMQIQPQNHLTFEQTKDLLAHDRTRNLEIEKMKVRQQLPAHTPFESKKR